MLSSARSSLNSVGLGKPWKDRLDLFTKAPAVPDRKRYSIKRSITASRLRRGFHKGLNAEKQAHDSTRSIFLDPGREAILRFQTSFLAVDSRQIVYGPQYEVVKIPSIGFEPFEKIAAGSE